MKTIIVHKPKRCRNPRIEVFDDHIDKVNNVRSKKYIPEGSVFKWVWVVKIYSTHI